MFKPPVTPELTVDALIPWLRKQQPDAEYIWSDPVFCMMGRFLADHGSQWGEVAYSDMPHYEQIAGAKPWTYGAALKRAERLALPAPTSQPLALERVDHDTWRAPRSLELQPQQQ